MRSAQARQARSVHTQQTHRRDHFEHYRGESSSSGTSSRPDGDPRLALLEAGASLVGALRSVPIELQRKLSKIVKGLPNLEIHLDASTVRPSRWGGRHESAFRTQAFAEFKESIRQHKGNVQAILVIKLPDGGYEIVFGHRRHRACLELGLPVKAVVWNGGVDDTELLLIQDAENRFRASPSVLDQGRMYTALIREKVFDSQRALARAFDISHTWVRKAMSVAALPETVMAAFEDPGQIQAHHALRIAKALESSGAEGVLRRATELAGKDAPGSAARVVDCLLGLEKGANAAPLKDGRQLLGSWKRDGKGCLVLTLDRALSSPEMLSKIEKLLGSLVPTDDVET